MGERGVAVIMAMWLLAVLAIIGTTFIFMMRLEPLIARTHRDDMMAFYVAQAGIDHAVYILKRDVGGTVDHLGEAWASGLTDQVLLDEQEYSVGSYTVTMSDESGKTDLNTAPKSQLEALDGIGPVKADAIITYRGGSYRPFETIDELMCVEGISQTIFDNNKEIITVYTDGLTNLNTAPQRVLTGIEDGPDSGLTSIEAGHIIDYRNGEDDVDGTPDDDIYDTPTLPPVGTSEPTTEVNNASYINDIETEYLTGEDASSEVVNTTKRVSVESSGAFTIISTGKYVSPSGQETVKKLRVVVDRGKQTPAIESRIKYYKEKPEE